MKTVRLVIFWNLLLTGALTLQAQLVNNDALGLRVWANFRVTLFADEKLANDISAMTLDAKGRLVVTGPGYIKRLEDTHGTGKADKAVLFAPTKTGGMGMCFDGNDLLFFGDGALSRYRDADGDGVADGPPERIMPFGGSEHGAHAIRRGPDGSWYLIGGNDAGFSSFTVTSPNSPVHSPEAGCLLRFSPDFQNIEIIAHGFRNPYDFDFDAKHFGMSADFTKVRLLEIADEADLGEVNDLCALFGGVIEKFEWRVVRRTNAEEIDSQFD